MKWSKMQRNPLSQFIERSITHQQDIISRCELDSSKTLCFYYDTSQSSHSFSSLWLSQSWLITIVTFPRTPCPFSIPSSSSHPRTSILAFFDNRTTLHTFLLLAAKAQVSEMDPLLRLSESHHQLRQVYQVTPSSASTPCSEQWSVTITVTVPHIQLSVTPLIAQPAHPAQLFIDGVPCCCIHNRRMHWDTWREQWVCRCYHRKCRHCYYGKWGMRSSCCYHVGSHRAYRITCCQRDCGSQRSIPFSQA